MSGAATPAQIAAFAVALRAKGETVAEVTGLVRTMFELATPLTVEGPVLDIVGTGGDRAHTVNVSTMAAIVAAAAGARVVKHGNRAASSLCGAADVLERLGVAIDLAPRLTARVAVEAGIAFCFAPLYHSALRFTGPPRKEIGVPTVFNFVGPLANPARPAAQAIGVFDARMLPVMAGVFAERGVSALVFRGDDGLDELSTAAPSTVFVVREGTATRTVFDPADLGVPVPSRPTCAAATWTSTPQRCTTCCAARPGPYGTPCCSTRRPAWSRTTAPATTSSPTCARRTPGRWRRSTRAGRRRPWSGGWT